MYAIIEADGKNYKVAEGDVIRCDRIHAELGGSIVFDKVLLISSESGLQVGTESTNGIVAGASVTATVLRQDKDKKILVFKYKPKKRVRKLHGHRQSFAEVKIDRIVTPVA